MSQTHIVTFTRHQMAELLPAGEIPVVGPGHVGGPTLASLISAGTEIGHGYTRETFPYHPGYAAVFRVEQVGEGVTDFKIGDLALGMSRHASYQTARVEDVWKLPEGLDAQHATFARLMGVSMSTLTSTTARPPDKVVVAGLGPVGHLAAQIFQGCGYQVLAFDPDANRRELAQKAGVKNVVAASPIGDPEWDGKTSLVLECSGHEAAMLDATKVIKKRGEVVLIGVPWRRRTELSAHDLLDVIFHRYAVVRSGWEWEVPRMPTDFKTGSIQENIQAAMEWLKDGRVNVAGNYAVYNPQDCQNAYQALLTAQEKSLAVVFDWTAI